MILRRQNRDEDKNEANNYVFIFTVVQGRQNQDQRRSAGFVGPARHRSQRRPARQSRRNFPREIRGEIRLAAPAGLALVSQVGVILVHQSNVHKWVSAHYAVSY